MRMLNMLPASFLLLFLLAACNLQAQFTLSGQILDSEDGSSLIGVNILLEGGSRGTSSDLEGKFQLNLDAGEYRIRFRYVGYQEIDTTLSLNEDSYLDLRMLSKSEQLDIVVVSTAFYEKPLEKEAVSVEVIGANLIANANTINLSDAIQKAPGVYLLDGQANIRGGTGYTYGAGSRVLVVVDDQPILSADRSDVKWSFIPMENVAQIEVIKGASSVLYGASALNGVIHVQTYWPGSEPESGIELFSGITTSPDSAHRQWWDFPPYSIGARAWHRQKYGQMDLVLGGSVSREITHLEGQDNDRARINGKLRWRPKNNDQLSYGLGFNAMYNSEGSYLIWSDNDTGAYQPFGGLEEPLTTILDWKYSWFTLDPFMTYFDKRDGTHRLKGRLYNNNTTYPDTTGSSYLTNLDYRYIRPFFRDVNLTAGFSGFYFDVKDGNLGDHRGFLGGLFAQVDKEFWGRLSVNMGFRMEYFDTDSVSGTGAPIFKGGLNYQLNSKNYLRASFGMGYRFPSLVERYSNTNVGALQIFPNDTLKPEYGWNAEVGYKRNIIFDAFKGYLDAALYWTEYTNMTEFVFGAWGGEPPGGLGFRTINVSKARIAGLELSASGGGRIGPVQVNLIGGYNYVYPADLGADTTNRNVGSFLSNAVEGFASADSSFTQGVLKYRFRHTFRMDLEFRWKIWRLGMDVSYYSFMENIDDVFASFGIPPGVAEFRETHNGGDAIWGVRFGVHPSEKTSVAVLVRNLFDREYALRVGKIDPPRSINLQYRMSF
jgi:iron complex outermembrane receptor protein